MPFWKSSNILLAGVCSSFGNAAILDITSHCFTCWLFLLSSFCSVGSLQNILLSRRPGFVACKGQRCLGKKGENGPAGYFHALTNVQGVTPQRYQKKQILNNKKINYLKKKKYMQRAIYNWPVHINEVDVQLCTKSNN